MEDELDFSKLLSDVLGRLMDGETDLIAPAPSAPHLLCNICHRFEPGLSTNTPTSEFLHSDCPGCSIVLQILDAVTDIRRPEFTAIELERKEYPKGSWDPKGVLKIRCIQKARLNPVHIMNRDYDDPFPNKYSVYTPASESFRFMHTHRFTTVRKIVSFTVLAYK
jgi:hypothetical protein